MARIPDGARLIDNPISKAPGFTIGNVHVMAGVPQVFRAMVDGLMPRLTGGKPLISRTVRIDMPEGRLAGPLGEVASGNPSVSIGCYPFSKDGVPGANVVLRSDDATRLDKAEAELRAIVTD